ncbi:MAG: hypothetical protein Kow0088_06210 [Anaerolineales bacterium]
MFHELAQILGLDENPYLVAENLVLEKETRLVPGLTFSRLNLGRAVIFTARLTLFFLLFDADYFSAFVVSTGWTHGMG